MKFIEQDSVWQSRKRFDAMGRGRFIAKKLSTPIHLEKPTTVPIAIQSVCICVHLWFRIRIAKLRATRMRIGWGQTLNNQIHEPLSSPDVEECDWIDTLVTRCISANDPHHRMRWEDLPHQKPRLPHSGACDC
jgi:hypothetical protein